MAPHSSILAWRIPMDRGAWQATGSLRVGHDYLKLSMSLFRTLGSDSASYLFGQRSLCLQGLMPALISAFLEGLPWWSRV